MDNKTYDDYKKALETAKDADDKETVEQIKARLIAKYGREDDDVDTLFRYHT